MAVPTGRDPDATRRALESWLCPQLGAETVVVDDLRLPRAGFSNETILGRARWEVEGVARERPFVLRIGATDHQLFPDADAVRQADVMRSLAGRVPVPGIWCADRDPSVFGAPFFLMDRVEGRVPPDLPTWHKKGWVTELAPRDRARLYDNGLAAMAALHAVDWRDGLAFLEIEGAGTALDRYLAHVVGWKAWCGSAVDVGRGVIEAALAFVLDHEPDDDEAVTSWGDARPGNLMYDDALDVAAMVDWEGATIGPAAVDVGWWLMFEHYLSDAQGVPRLEGIPGRDATIERYEALTGRDLSGVAYYEVLAGLVFALINSRLFEILVAGGHADRAAAEVVLGRVTDGIELAMARAR